MRHNELRSVAVHRLTVVLAVLTLAALPALAQIPAPTWPQRPVKFIVPFGPGAGADIGARLLQDRLAARWGKPVVIENRPGGDGLVAIQAFLTANDDHTLLFSPSGNFTVHPYQYDKLPYTPADLVPIARVSNTIIAVGAPASMNFVTMTDWVARAKAQPGAFNVSAVPGFTEFVFDYFVKTAGLAVQKIPYRDTVQAATDVGEARLQLYMASYAILQSQTEAGRIKLMVVNGKERIPILPAIPTVFEAGFPALEYEGLVGLFGLKTMPKDLIGRIGADMVEATKDPAVSTRLHATAQVANPGGPGEFAASIDAQRAQIARIAAALGIKPKQ
jgi:tripartite-type tricarboxylate transporter receptor subunit TctC